MKTPAISVNTNKFRNTIACFAVAATLFFGQGAMAQSERVIDNEPAKSETTGSFRAVIFPVQNSLIMKVNFENPSREMMMVVIKNSNNEIVYKKIVGRNALYRGKFDVSGMPNGSYTISVQSPHQKHSNAFAIETQQERVALALNK